MNAFKQTLYMPLFVQQPPAIQRALFASAIERTAPKCEHSEAGWQHGLFGGDPVYCCTFCGEERPEPAT